MNPGRGRALAWQAGGCAKSPVKRAAGVIRTRDLVLTKDVLYL